MVYSQTRKTSSVASITNQNTGGGSKKAGLPYTVGRPATSSVAFRTTIVMGSALQTPTTLQPAYLVLLDLALCIGVKSVRIFVIRKTI